MTKINLALILSLFFLTSCYKDHGTFTVLTNRDYDLSNYSKEKTQVLKNIKTKDVGHTYVVVPLKPNPNLSGALSNAFNAADADIMLDTRVESWFWYIPYVYGYQGWRINGNAIKTKP